MASGGDDKSIKIWDVSKAELISTISAPAAIKEVVISPDGQIIAAAPGDQTVILWNVRTGERLKLLKPYGEVTSVVFSPNGKILGIGGLGLAAIFWDVDTGKPSTPTARESNFIFSAAFSHDGRILAFGDIDGNVKFWDVLAGTLIKSYRAHNSSIHSIEFSANDSVLATGSSDGTVKLWETDKPRLIASLIALGSSGWPEKYIWAVVTPEGRFDTNDDLENIRNIHWILSDDPLTPKPLDLYMRQYYEPNLLSRLFKCRTQTGIDGTHTCDDEFKPLPPIGTINRVRTKMGIID